MLGFNTGLMTDIGRAQTVAGSAGNGYTEALTVTLAPVERPGVNAAPSPAWFEVADVTGSTAGNPGAGEAREPKFHDLTYVWDFGDAANATPWNAAALRMPAVWKDINRAYGKRVCHVYSTPGTYTVTVTVYERSSLKKGTATTTVTVADPKAAFPGNRTIIFNPSGMDLAPYGYTGAQNLTSWTAVTNARNTLGAAAAQILIAPGVTLSNTQLANNPSWGNIRIGALDQSQPRPVINGFVNEGSNLIRDISPALNIERVLFGLRFAGDWDSTTETGRVVEPFRTFVPTVPTYLIMNHRCEFDGWDSVTSFSGSTAGFNSYVVHSELSVTNWQNYGVTTAGDNAAIIACSLAQHQNALSGGAKDTGFYNNHGPIRDFNAKSMHISVCDLFSRNGWSAGGSAADGLTITSDQACLRLNANGDTGCKGNIERITAEGMIWIEEADNTNVDVPVNYVFDKVLQIMGPRTLQEGIELRYGGCTFRNMLGVILNAPSAQSNRPSRWFYLTNEDGAADNDAGIDIYNCTLVDLRSNANANNNTTSLRTNDADAGDAFLVQTIENNIFAQPNRSPPVVPDAINMGSTFDFFPRHRGPRVNFLREAGTLGANVAPGAFFALSYADVKTTRYNQSLTDSGTATSQAYWQANAGPRHKMVMGGATLHAQVANTFEVTFEPTEIRIWNRTASTTWATGTAWELMLQRSLVLPAWDPQFDMRTQQVPLARPTGPGALLNTNENVGLLAYDDFLCAVRPVTGNARGALLP